MMFIIGALCGIAFTMGIFAWALCHDWKLKRSKDEY